VDFALVHVDMEISQSRFSCSSKGAGSDPFQNTVAEIVRIRILAFWSSIKEWKFLAAEKYHEHRLFESIF
jgi:hypothetical protein